MAANRLVTRRRIAAFALKAAAFRARRTLRNVTGGGVRRWARHTRLETAPVLAETRAPLWSDADDLWHQLGKVQNLRVAARRLDGVEVPADGTLSFWAQVGRPTRRSGYTIGRELREGCLIPSVGGGLCLLSNALYQVALRAGFEIVERHAHSARVPGSAAIAGQDATVFWNYVDLRFRAQHAFRVEVVLSEDELVVRVRGIGAIRDAVAVGAAPIPIGALAEAESEDCGSCGIDECVRHAPELTHARGATAILVDGVWPEFDAALRASDRGTQRFFVPIDGGRRGSKRYAWSTDGSAGVVTAPLATARRALRSRRLAAQGAARQRAQIEEEARLARAYERRLNASVTRLYVQQGLLPELFRSGELGGRTFSVLADRLSIRAVHAQLDRLAAAHPESPTAADFRAPSELEALEWRALERAERIVTPHVEIAAQFPGKSHVLPWQPSRRRLVRRTNGGGRPRLLFPAPTLARKGAYELRAALAGKDCELLLFPGEFEGARFWDGKDVTFIDRATLEREPVDVVVLPAWVEFQPRVLLAALDAGIPVIATTACGLPPRAGLTLCEAGDVATLSASIERVLAGLKGGARCAPPGASERSRR